MNSLNLNQSNSSAWHKATVIGSIWGSFEIVAGSLLHNLSIPLAAGTALSALGVIVLVVGAKVYGGRGIFIRSALVCAALKTVSPSPVILTPMIGITIEGLLMEISVFLLGNNIFGFIVGGSLAVLSVLGFKLVRWLMIYGTDIFEAYKSLFSIVFSDEFMNSYGYLLPLLFFVILYIIIGAFAAYIGFKGGNTIALKFGNKSISFLPSNDYYKPKMKEGYKGGIVFLIFQMLWLFAFISLKNIIPHYYWLSVGLVYLVLCFYRYGRVRVLMLSRSFWIVLFIVSISSSVFILIGKYGSSFPVFELFSNTITLLLRASVVIVCFLCISIELRSKGVSHHFEKGIFSPLIQSYNQAQSVLPSLLQTLKKDSKKVFQPIPLIEKMFFHFSDNGSLTKLRSEIFIITADRQGGKTTFMLEMLKIFELKNMPVHGFLAEGLFDDNYQRKGFEMITLPEKERIPLCDRTSSHWLLHGSYYFNPKALEIGNQILNSITDHVVVFIDEVGLNELEGLLWANSFARLCEEKKHPIVVSIRRPFINQAIAKWNLGFPTIIDVTSKSPEDVVLNILSEKNRT